MSEVKNIATSRIDLDSAINVRRQAIEGNVEKVKLSIQEHGYWPDMPIVVRPHPDSRSQYDYQHVTGQCRLKACLALGLEIIPAFVLELDDDEAIQRSWLENEARGDLTASDKAYWTERTYRRYSGAGHTAQEAIKLAAKYLGVTVQTVQNYYSLVALPGDLKKMVDQGILSSGIAVSIVRNTFDGARVEESQEAMRNRASWVLGLDRDSREHGRKALEQLKHGATIADLNSYVTEKASESRRVVNYAIPGELYGELLQWGKSRGLEDATTIISHMVAEILRESR